MRHETARPNAHRRAESLPHQWSFPATGTTWSVHTRAALSEPVRERITDFVERFEATWSRFRQSSLVRRIAAGDLGDGPLVVDLPGGDGALLDLYDRLYCATGGRLDPMVGADLLELGYDPAMSFAPRDGAAQRLGARHGRATWASTVSHRGDRMRLEAPGLIDIGAAGKGFMADRIGEILAARGVPEFLIDASGDLLVRTARPLRIGLEAPGRPGFIVGTVRVDRGAVCGSGVQPRTWGDGLHHILDGLTGLPAQQVTASWVVAESCALADGLATALFTCEPARLAAEFAYDFALLRANGSAATSRSFSRLGRLFTAVGPARRATPADQGAEDVEGAVPAAHPGAALGARLRETREMRQGHLSA